MRRQRRFFQLSASRRRFKSLRTRRSFSLAAMAALLLAPADDVCFGNNRFVRVAVQTADFQFRAVGARELAQAECQGRAAVMIELVSADSFRKTGISVDKAGDCRRFAPQGGRTGSPETKSNARKAGISGPFSRFLESLFERMTAWLAAQCRWHMSPGRFPAIREFYRESSEFSGSESRPLGRNRCSTVAFS